MEILVITFIVLFLSALVNVVLYGLSNAILGKRKEKFTKVIKLPIPERYKTKVNPIYEVGKSDFTGDYYIFKYSLKYKRNELCAMLCFFFIPYPIIVERYQYVLEGELWIGDEQKMRMFEASIEEYYEYHNKIEMDKQQREKEERNKLQNKLNTLNKTFKENYE